jgi:hypothetical protein
MRLASDEVSVVHASVEPAAVVQGLVDVAEVMLAAAQRLAVLEEVREMLQVASRALVNSSWQTFGFACEAFGSAIGTLPVCPAYPSSSSS